MQVSIIMPTHNDDKTIKESITSVLNQTLDDWELIIVDDGSTDNTKEIVKNFTLNKINYIYQENSDQLNAIINGLQYASGNYIYVLHSDDLIYDEKTLEKCVNYMNKNKEVDSIIADLEIINDNGQTTKIQNVSDFKYFKYLLPLQLLWLGRNLYVDVGFHRKDSYIKKIKSNYLKWNTPFWIDFKKNIEVLNVKKVDFIIYKYRVHENNYITEEIGKLNVINGELRTAIELMEYYCIQWYVFQYMLFRMCNKLKIKYKPIYKCEKQKNKYHIVKFIIKRRFGNSYVDNIFLKSLVMFYKRNIKRSIKLNNSIKDEDIFYGKDIRRFNTLMNEGKLSNFYKRIFCEMQKGFDRIIVQDETEKNKVEDICKFLCINNEIQIEINIDKGEDNGKHRGKQN